jgi:hypothetical protein
MPHFERGPARSRGREARLDNEKSPASREHEVTAASGDRCHQNAC